jgi:hypothetical protein
MIRCLENDKYERFWTEPVVENGNESQNIVGEIRKNITADLTMDDVKAVIRLQY